MSPPMALRYSRHPEIMTLDTLVAELPLRGIAVASPLSVRHMYRTDSERLVDLWFACYHDTLAAETTREEELADWTAAFNGEYGCVLTAASLVVESDQALVAAIQTVLDPPWPHTPSGPFIIELLVHPRCRRHGVGTALIQQACQAAYYLNHTTIALRVDRNNIGAHSLYRTLGFTDWQP